MTKQQIEQLRKQGLTLQAIGTMFGTSRQRVWQVLNPEYQKEYQKTDKCKKFHKIYYKKNKLKLLEQDKKYTKDRKLKIQNLALEVCSLVESGTLTVGALGISQESCNTARNLTNKK